MKFRLLELRPNLLDEYDDLYNMLQEFPAVDEWGQENEFFGKSRAEVKEIICKDMRLVYGLEEEPNVLPVEKFVLFADDKPVCLGILRLKLDDYWMCHGGNLGYRTRPSERRKGYCTKFVELLCQRAKELGLSEVLAQCKVENIASDNLLKKLGFVRNHGEMFDKRPSRNYYKKVL